MIIDSNRGPLHPREIIRMDERKELSPALRAAWKESVGEDPAHAARRCLRDTIRLTVAGFLLILTSLASFVVADEQGMWSMVGWKPTLSALLMVMNVMIGLLLIVLRGHSTHQFMYSKEGFGRNFRGLCVLLEKIPHEFVSLDKEGTLKAMSTDALKKLAKDVRKAQNDYINRFEKAHSIEDARAVEKDLLERRNRFSAMAEMVKRFDLHDPNGWASYFSDDEGLSAET